MREMGRGMRDRTAALGRGLRAACFLLTVAGGPASGAAAPVVVPFDFHRREVLIEATVNGQGPFPMLLDTGTDPSIIDLALARRLGLALTPEGRGGSGGGTEKNPVYAASLPAVGVGGLSAANTDALALDLSALSRRFGRPLRGVLGHSFLQGRVVQFDFPARRVRFLSALPPPSGAAARTALPFHGEDGVRVNGCLINGRPVVANIDTGSNSGFQLTPPAVRALGLAAQALRGRPAPGAGFNGAYAARTGTVRRISLGAAVATRPAVTFWLPGTGHDDARWGVNIGNAFLQNYVLTLDYARQRLTLDRPRP